MSTSFLLAFYLAGGINDVPAPPPNLPASYLRTLTNPAPRHEGKAICVAYSPDGKILASSGWDKRIRLWDATTGKAIRDWQAHNDAVWPLAFSADGKHLVSGGRDGNVILWDLTGREIRRFTGHTAGVYKLVWIHAEDRLLTASFDRSVREWDLTTGKQLHKLTQEQEVHALAVAPNRKQFATGTERGRITLYNRDFTEHSAWDAHGTGIDHLSYSPDGKTLVSGGWDKTAVLWDPRDGAKLRTLEGHRDHVWPVVFSPDGKRLLTASRDGAIRVWNPTRGELLREIVGPTQGVPMLAFRSDGKVFASACWDGTIQQWDLATGQPIGPTPGALERILDLRLSKDGRELLTLSGDGRALAWDLRTGLATVRAQARLESPRTGVLGERLAILADAQNPARLLDLARPFTFQEFPLGTNLAGVRFSPDERQLIALTQAGKLAVHAIAEGIELTQAQLTPAQGLALTPDGKEFVTIAPQVGLRWHRSADAQLLRTVPVPALRIPESIHSSPDGRLILGVSPRWVRAWEAVSGKERFFLELENDSARAVAFSHEGRWLFLVDSGNQWMAIDLMRGVPVLKRHGPRAEPTALTVSADGNLLAVGRIEGEIDLWDLTAEKAAFRATQVAHPLARLRQWREDLASENPEKIQAALIGLCEAGPDTVALLAPWVRPTPRLEAGRVMKLIEQLDSDDFDTRETARMALLALGPRVEEEVEKALERPRSLDHRRLLEAIRTDLLATPLNAEGLRELRQLEILERLGASEVIQPLTRGDPAALLTRQARAALERLCR